jgi:uncharacterized protein involved in type VI secretion and phage assembly
MSLAEMLYQSKKQESLILGVVSGVVTNNQDPDGLGRIKVKLPRISGEDESNWARVISFMAGKDRGAFYLPEVDDEVLVAFEYGDINRPYVIGSLWNGVDTPPADNGDGENNIRVIKSRSGHLVRLDDTDGAEKIEIIDKSEKNLITIDTSENKITISSDQDIDILAPNGKVLIDADQFEIKSAGASKIESGASLDVNASGDLTATGATIKLN